jgi:hypothetical protein
VPDEDVELPGLAAMDCMPAGGAGLRADAVLTAGIRVDSQSAGSEPDGQLVLHADGTLITGRIGASRAYNTFPTARRLSPEGMALLIGAVEDSGLVAPGCHLDLLDTPPLRGVTLRFPDGRVGTTDWGQYGGFTRMLTDAERAAADTLIARLEDLSWLPANAWVSASEEERRPAQWVVTIMRVSEAEAANEPAGARKAPPLDEVAAPGGGSLLEFGTEFTDPALRYTEVDGSEHVQDGLVRRCAIVSAAEAEDLAARLDAAGAPTFNAAWWLADPPEFVTILITPYQWEAGECAQYLAGQTPPPAEIVLPTPEPAPSGLDACAVLPLEDVVSLLPLVAEFPATMRSGREERGVTYATCHYGGRDGPGLTVLLRPGAVSELIAGAIARTWLGPEARHSLTAGAHVWENACVATDHVYCVPVVAVWHDGSLVLARLDSIHEGRRELVDAIVPMLVDWLKGGIS